MSYWWVFEYSWFKKNHYHNDCSYVCMVVETFSLISIRYFNLINKVYCIFDVQYLLSLLAIIWINTENISVKLFHWFRNKICFREIFIFQHIFFIQPKHFNWCSLWTETNINDKTISQFKHESIKLIRFCFWELFYTVCLIFILFYFIAWQLLERISGVNLFSYEWF